MPKPIKVWLIALLCSFTSPVIHADNVAFYIGAHQDDQGYRTMKQVRPTLFRDKLHPIQL